jgi:hypothetical protein
MGPTNDEIRAALDRVIATKRCGVLLGLRSTVTSARLRSRMREDVD